MYFDHPVHAMAEHTLNIDLRRSGAGPGAARRAVELTAACRARASSPRITEALAARPGRADRWLGSAFVRAVYAESINPDDPLAGLVVGERPDPVAADGWTRVAVQGRQPEPPRSVDAARRRHHRRAAADDPRAAMRPGIDAATGAEVVVHSVIATPGWDGDETLDPGRSLLSEKHQGTLAEYVDRAEAQRGAQAGRHCRSPRRRACRRRG